MSTWEQRLQSDRVGMPSRRRRRLEDGELSRSTLWARTNGRGVLWLRRGKAVGVGESEVATPRAATGSSRRAPWIGDAKLFAHCCCACCRCFMRRCTFSRARCELGGRAKKKTKRKTKSRATRRYESEKNIACVDCFRGPAAAAWRASTARLVLTIFFCRCKGIRLTAQRRSFKRDVKGGEENKCLEGTEKGVTGEVRLHMLLLLHTNCYDPRRISYN